MAVRCQVRFSVRVAAQVKRYARDRAISVSAAIRDLVERQLGVVDDEPSSGWRRGYEAGYAEVHRRLDR